MSFLDMKKRAVLLNAKCNIKIIIVTALIFWSRLALSSSCVGALNSDLKVHSSLQNTSNSAPISNAQQEYLNFYQQSLRASLQILN